jgi:hypothetical protein
MLASATISHGAAAVETVSRSLGTVAVRTTHLPPVSEVTLVLKLTRVSSVILLLVFEVAGPSPSLRRRLNVLFAFVTDCCTLLRLAAPWRPPTPAPPREGGWPVLLLALPWTPSIRIAATPMQRPRPLTMPRTAATFLPGDVRRSGFILLTCTRATPATSLLDASYLLLLPSAPMESLLLEPCKPLAAGRPTPPTAR